MSSEHAEIRPLVVAHPYDDTEAELTAARWDADTAAWIANDGRRFEGPPPAEADDLVVVMAEPSLGDTLTGAIPDGVRQFGNLDE